MLRVAPGAMSVFAPALTATPNPNCPDILSEDMGTGVGVAIMGVGGAVVSVTGGAPAG
jgi:hypothetical protein